MKFSWKSYTNFFEIFFLCFHICIINYLFILRRKEEKKLLLEGGMMFIPPRSMTPNVEKGMSTFYKLLLLLFLFGFFLFLEWLAFVVFILSSSLCV